MTLEQFLAFFTGIFCDYDGAYGDQCFDLANAYSRWIGGQRFTGATADLIYNQPGDFYEQVKNGATNFPVKGDIVLWDWPHVGIATGNNTDSNQFEVLEQNDPEDSNCHVKVYPNYKGVIGWLHPKQLPRDTQAIIDELRTARDTDYNNWQGEVTKNGELTQKNADQQKELDDRQNAINTLNSKVSQLTTVLSQDALQDHDMGVKLLALEHSLNSICDSLGLPQDSSIDQITASIANLKKPHDEVVKQVQPTLDKLADAAFRKTRSPKVKSLLQKIKDLFHL